MLILESKQNYKESTNKSPLIIESRAWKSSTDLEIIHRNTQE